MIELFTKCGFDIQWFLSISATVGKVRTAHPASLKLTSKKFWNKKREVVSARWLLEKSSIMWNYRNCMILESQSSLLWMSSHIAIASSSSKTKKLERLKEAGFILVLYIGSTLHSGHTARSLHFAYTFPSQTVSRNPNKLSPETVFINQCAHFAFINCHHKLLWLLPGYPASSCLMIQHQSISPWPHPSCLDFVSMSLPDLATWILSGR